jgi:hypothetical protein
MKASKVFFYSMRFGLWSVLGVHLYVTGMKANLPVLAYIASMVMFGYAGSIILEAILKMNKESQDVRKDQELDAEDESGRVSSSDAEGPKNR